MNSRMRLRAKISFKSLMLLLTFYMCYGAGHSFGVDLDRCFAEVQRSNMSKLGVTEEPIYREDGKVLKGFETTVIQTCMKFCFQHTFKREQKSSRKTLDICTVNAYIHGKYERAYI